MSAAGSPVRTIIVGAGRFGALHARAWKEAGADIVGLVDVDEARLSEVAARVGALNLSCDAEVLLKETQPDVVVIATAEDSHVEITEIALQNNCHVLVEKPFALTAEEARRVMGLAKQRNREVIAGHISRFAQPYRAMRDAMDAGRIGDLWSLRLRRDFSRSWFKAFGARVNPVWESCIHDVDLALYFTNARAARVVAMRSEAAGASASSIVSSLIQFDNGVLATVETAWSVPEQAPQTESGALELPGSIVAEAEAHGSSGVVKQRLLSDALTVWSDAATWSPNPALWPLTDGIVGGALRSEVEYAIDVVKGNRSNDLMPMDHAVEGIVIAEAIVESLKSAQPVLLTTP
ncbi:Gfo/Idh/MocA family oxidoreductase (plasmid) [Arthrobacter sp. zg-Y820]|uniref:Gfo/Idh/MocA family oxidoreductase n=1 Tax=unclassified Arthrobacter TaxID=235627 RepID=UPI001E518810|nr:MULTISPECIES: Gfo/Idh/MocA family oxidoreductase [unclassified Arthrobacter]MCC9198521.1 Gfo/Idh/MocA family oxidoreductase [Arthrobacter sp. zg-Y820]MDK1281391.1 Gfo/Idh/MocA family oxidoreductase [Arthrobacter sp. zg.Y820]WIB11262.1 Gfo/Idh/MocA family oxidoreductase [Arthrobacter sp. zg-Y820]